MAGRPSVPVKVLVVRHYAYAGCVI